MASYVPLQRYDPEDDSAGDVDKRPLLKDDSYNPEPREVAKSPSKWTDWIILFLSLLVLVSASMLYASSSRLPVPRYAQGLRMPDQHPGLDQVDELAKKRAGPMMIFPSTIVRANKALPDQVYERGRHVVLSDNDSMFYQLRLRTSKFKSCYIDAIVPTPEKGRAGNKTYTSSGPLSAIQVWNVTTPPERITSLSWNTRPERIALLGTVAFYPEDERTKMLDLEDGWQLRAPTPRFACGDGGVLTYEVACEGCTLEFDQIFSDPPLAFDLLEIG